MAVHLSKPTNIKQEKVKIEPEVFLNDARKYASTGDFNMAERAYVNALSNARGASNVKEIAKIVKEGLGEIYILWTQDCINRHEFQEAEPVLQKLLKISDDKRTAKEEFIKLYDAWGVSLSIYDKNWKGALLVKIKKLKLEKELGFNTDITKSQICSLLFSSNNKNNKKKAIELKLEKREERNRVFISSLIMAAVAIGTPIFAPFSISVYLFSCFMLFILPDWEGIAKNIRICVRLTFFSLAWLFIGTVFMTDDSYTIFSVVSLVLIIIISVRVLLYAMGQFKLYFSYQKQDILEVMKDIFPPVTISCKSCGTMLRVAGESISAVKCPKCGNVAREAIDLRIKNKPIPDAEGKEAKEFDPQYAWGRVGFHAGRAIAKEIIRNLRF